MKKLAVIIVLIGFLTGCATTQSENSQDRSPSSEQALKQKDRFRIIDRR